MNQTKGSPFHFLEILEKEEGVDVIVKGYDKGELKLRTLEAFNIPFKK